MKPTKHTQLSIAADCQLDPLQPNHHHNHYEQSNHQAHHSLLQSNGDGKLQAVIDGSIGGGVISGRGASSPSGISLGGSGGGGIIGGIMDSSSLRSATQNHHHHRQSPQMMGDPPEGDDTDPDVIPNQYGKFTN